MAQKQRIREVVSGVPSQERLQGKAQQGWKLVALEWEREGDAAPAAVDRVQEEIPFGLRVAKDCLHLEENPDEMQALTLMMESIVQDRPLSQAAQELNLRGFRTRGGAKWTQVSVFEMLPRVIEVGPHILSTDQWAVTRRRLFKVVLGCDVRRGRESVHCGVPIIIERLW